MNSNNLMENYISKYNRIWTFDMIKFVHFDRCSAYIHIIQGTLTKFVFSIARRPIRGVKSRSSIISMVSVNCSSEEGEASEYPSSSQRSTLDSVQSSSCRSQIENSQSRFQRLQESSSDTVRPASLSCGSSLEQARGPRDILVTSHLARMSLDGQSDSDNEVTVTSEVWKIEWGC